MSQNLIPLNGGRTRIETTPNVYLGTVLSPQYVFVKGESPRPNEWVAGGRPIYDRLPAISERYRIEFGLDGDTAYTYIPTGLGTAGKGTMQVQTSGDESYLTIQSGEIVSKYGRISVDPVIIDLRLVGMLSTRYFIGYQIFSDDAPFDAEYAVEDFSLAGYALNIGSGTDSVSGWRYTPQFAFADSSKVAWRNHDTMFPSYTGDAYLFWQSELSASYSKIKLRCPPNAVCTGTASLYYQTCPNPIQGEIYCSNPEWSIQSTTEVQKDSEGYYFEFYTPTPTPQYGWKVTWTDSEVSIAAITVTGTVTLKRKPSNPLTYCQLIAYPENAVPKATLSPSGEEIPLVLCSLAIVDVNNAYQVEKVSDIRQIVNTDYEPIADWLTRAWDTNLINLYEQVDNFSNTWMSPVDSMYPEYETLTNDLVIVKN